MGCGTSKSIEVSTASSHRSDNDKDVSVEKKSGPKVIEDSKGRSRNEIILQPLHQQQQKYFGKEENAVKTNQSKTEDKNESLTEVSGPKPHVLSKKDLITDLKQFSNLHQRTNQSRTEDKDENLTEVSGAIPPVLSKKDLITDLKHFLKVDQRAKDIQDSKERSEHEIILQPLHQQHQEHFGKEENAVKTNQFKTEDTDENQTEVSGPKPPVLSKKDLITDLKQFSNVDQRAKNAPEQLRSSLPDLVEYLGKESKDPIHLVRSFFVWIAYHVRYDAAGFFGTAPMAPCDYKSVMTSGLSVCAGYANVMEAMCKKAAIPVKIISGFAKGYGHSPGTAVTINHQTNHAWNSVYIRGNWFLIDSTWGAGHLEKNGIFKVKFDEFYFISDPEKLIQSHFPYMGENMEESMKWQLLKIPVSLECFNSSLLIQPAAFDIGVLPRSHTQSIVHFEDEVELTFDQTLRKENTYLSTLYKEEENLLTEEQFSTHMYTNNELLKIKVKPEKSGNYRLQLFGRPQSSNSHEQLQQLFEYTLLCTVPAEKLQLRRFPFPKTYRHAIADECQVLEPFGNQIPANTEIKMRFKSPVLKRMMIFKKMLRQNGDIFEGTIVTPDRNYLIPVYGSRLEKGLLDAQYEFCVG